jgi:hypothetical protein
MEVVERSEKHVVIPPENRVIAFRVEQRFFNSVYHGNVKIWPESGHIRTLTEKGLFAVTFGQNYGEVLLRCVYYIDPFFHILEVDSRKIIEKNNTEIEFSEANILFTGYIEEFIVEIQKHCSPEHYFDIYQTFFVKLYNVLDAKENPEHRVGYIISCLEILHKMLLDSPLISKMWYRPEKQATK